MSLRRVVPALVPLLALLACSRPDSRPPVADADQLREEATVQRELARAGGASAYHHLFSADEVEGAEADFARLVRLHGLAMPVLRGAVDLCRDRVRPDLGMAVGDLVDVPMPLRPWYQQQHGFAEFQPVVLLVAPGGPAAAAGIQPGDRILAVNGEQPKSKVGFESPEHLIATRLSGETAQLDVLRGDRRLQITVRPDRACATSVRLIRSGAINAYADGKEIEMAVGMMDWLKDDDQLAIVIGHELAHNMMGHMAKKDENGATAKKVGSWLDYITGGDELSERMRGAARHAYNQAFEAEADYVGLYMAARAGVPVGKAADLWRRMAMANPASIDKAVTHPTSPERSVALAAAVKEIEAKRAQGLPLVPEMRK